MIEIIQNHWYKKPKLLLGIILYPLSIIFYIISTLRKFLYIQGILKQYQLPIPVIIIGNITVGGVGKTPLTKHIAQTLINQGIKVGVILRGYKGTNTTATIVTRDSQSSWVGDEALIYAQNNIPVAIGKNRYLAGMELIKHHPKLQLILSDDGLQHYRLKRDYEIVVIDKTRKLGNEFLLPMGPLREPTSRLGNVNTIIINGANSDELNYLINQYKIPNTIMLIAQNVLFDGIYDQHNQKLALEFFENKTILIMSAIGNPKRFANLVTQLGIKITDTLEFPDHHHYKKSDIPNNYDLILVTEKDYTKLNQFNNDKILVVKIKIALSQEEDFFNTLTQRIPLDDK